VTDPHDIRDDLEPGADEEILRLAERLRAGRPLPHPAFRGELGRRLQARSPRIRARVRLQIAGYATSGGLLLLIGAISASGTGPLG
jgi:hypothetical protein